MKFERKLSYGYYVFLPKTFAALDMKVSLRLLVYKSLFIMLCSLWQYVQTSVA